MRMPSSAIRIPSCLIYVTPVFIRQAAIWVNAAFYKGQFYNESSSEPLSHTQPQKAVELYVSEVPKQTPERVSPELFLSRRLKVHLSELSYGDATL